MKTSIKKGIKDNEMFLVMDSKLDSLRKDIWRTIHKEKNKLSDCDVSMVLGIVNYELVHHCDEKNE